MKWIQKKLEIILLLCIILSCQSNLPIQEVCQERKIDQKLKSIPKEIESMFLYIPSRILLLDSNHLLIYDNIQEDYFKVISLKEDRLLTSWGLIGAGPNENQMVNDQSIHSYKDSFYFIDINKLYRYDFKDNFDSISSILISEIRRSFDPINNFVRISDSTFWMDNMSANINIETPEFIEVSFLNSSDRGFEQYPFTQSINNDFGGNPVARFMKYSAFTPGREHVAYFYVYQPFWKLLLNSGEELQYIFYDELSEKNKERPPLQTVYAEGSEKYIYSLYLGADSEVYFDRDSDAFPELHIWSWDGRWLARYELDRKISTFAVDEKNSKLYAVDIEGGEEIYVYFLPGL